jgi:DNA polymerase-3 subunit beta
MDSRDFPAMPEPSGAKGTAWRIGGDVLTEMIEHTVFAVSADETRVNLNGIFTECSESGRLRMVATDGHRLAMISRAVDGAEPTKGVIIPRKAVMELRKVLESGEEPIDISVEEGVAHAVRGAVQMSMRLVEGEFPDYQQVVPSKSEKKAVLSAGNLLAALRRVSIVSSERTRGVKLQLDPEKLELSSINPDVGEAAEEVEVEYAGDPVGVGFNAKYLIEALSVLSADDRIEIGLNDELSPGTLRRLDDPDYCYIVMPLRL